MHPHETHDATPLLTKAAQDAADRLAMVRSLRQEHTGLSKLKHKRVVQLLERLSSESFSDGVTTDACVSKLSAATGKDRSTIFRWLADAKTAGLIETIERYAACGRQLSSRRVVQWARIEDLVFPGRRQKRLEARGKTATGRVATATGRVATATPIIRSNPKQSEIVLRSEGATDTSDHENKNGDGIRYARVPADQIRDRVRWLCQTIGYRGSDAGTLWAIAAAEACNLISSHAVSDAASAVKHATGSIPNRVGYLRTVATEKDGLTKSQMKTILSRIRVLPRNPRKPPDPPPPRKSIPVMQHADANARRNNVLDELAKIADL